VNFDPLFSAFLGGCLIGLAAAIMLLWTGRIAGVSGVSKGLLDFKTGDIGWRVAFLSGLILGGLVFYWLQPGAFQIKLDRPLWLIAVAGLLVGAGQTLANGCTSGHGVCGVSRFSIRSIVATLTFMIAGFVTVFIYNGLSK
jgi:uncharacterized protein